jgi:hypothetical protein
MGKVLAIVFLVVFVWWAYPFVSRGLWIAPTAVMPDSWMGDYARATGQDLLATPPQGYGWYRFDFWHEESAQVPGRPVYKSDFRLQY